MEAGRKKKRYLRIGQFAAHRLKPSHPVTVVGSDSWSVYKYRAAGSGPFHDLPELGRVVHRSQHRSDMSREDIGLFHGADPFCVAGGEMNLGHALLVRKVLKRSKHPITPLAITSLVEGQLYLL